MPNNRRSRKNGSRKARRSPRSSAIKGFTAAPSVFPDKMTGKMIFSSSYSSSVPAGLITANVYRLNSIYDPDYTGTGTTVASYVQAAALYGKYRVTHARVIITATPTNSSGSYWFGNLVVVPSTALTLGTDPLAFRRQRYVDVRSLGSTGVTRRYDIPISRIYGVKPSVVKMEDDFAAVMGSSPSNQALLHVAVENPTGTSLNFYVDVRIEYTVELHLPLALAV